MTDGAISLGESKGGVAGPPSTKITGLDLRLGNIAVGPNLVKQITGQARLGGVEARVTGLGAPIAFKSGHLDLENGTAHGEFRAELGKAAGVNGKMHIARGQQQDSRRQPGRNRGHARKLVKV